MASRKARGVHSALLANAILWAGIACFGVGLYLFGSAFYTFDNELFAEARSVVQKERSALPGALVLACSLVITAIGVRLKRRS